ncbi:cytochrome P450 [Aspergillus homomorphus CBS 101889]|uniref:Cytochrome P450 monooxygenase n=1 Tax=Aspergillus homomorphus (strain CBS 101889) TaxID=1450537 RepID=A0A395I5P2_ASPHC|nr:cytochrome P450 monooxygenase [Aspergillus homomorphus CBS 101889]RAL15307.1 cytochrome P450 monooxygenase [Aspergillus homomorphus CBS 101889]
MPPKQFYLLGEPSSTAREIEVDSTLDFAGLQHLVAAHFAIVNPHGIGLQTEDAILYDVPDVLSSEELIRITIDGNPVREIPGPKGVPIIGNFFQVFPDHLGNHMRMFEQYGPIFKTNSMGRVTYHTNDPELNAIIFAESDFFTKKINEAHPLYPIRNKEAGVFLGDSDTPEWRTAHKFLPPAFGPKAVRHYAPTMQQTVEDSFKVFDALDEAEEAFNVYQYMLKLGSQAVGKLVLGIDFQHFTSVNAPPHELILLIAESLELNKKVSARGDWYSKLPFGDPKRLKDLRGRVFELIDESIQNASRGGVHDLPLQEAALQADNVIDYVIRATDNKGNKLPKTSLMESLVVATGAGFTTTSSLLSWLIYSLVTYDGMQERLLQELVDNDITEDTQLTAEITDRLAFMDKFIKECQRRHNPSFQPARTAKVDMILPGGYKLPAEAVVVGALHHLHMNPKAWSNPNRFDPDRWDTDEVKNRHKTSYIPFATGPRMCIGFNFALQEVKIFLPKLLYRYKFTKENDAEIEYDPMFQLIRPNNLYVRAERRVKWPPKTDFKPAASL